MANINKNIIMQAGAAVANATNKAAGLSTTTPEPGSIISAIQLVNGGRELGPASLLHFTESVRNKLLSLLVSMEPIQDFNGYGHPWPAGGGVNICPISESLNNPGVFWGANQNNIVSFLNTLPVGTYTFYITFEVVTLPENGKVQYGRPYVTALVNGEQTAVLSYSVQSDSSPYVGKTYRKGGSFTITEDIVGNFNSCYFYCDQDGSHSGTGRGTYNAIEFLIAQGSTITDYSPYENICPISGRTGLHVYAGPTSAIGDAATHSMDWTSPAGTVYAGSADVVTGDIKAAPYYASYNGETLVGPWVSSMDVYDPEGTPTTGAQVVDLGGTMTEYHITGQDIITLVGDNYVWSDSGDVTITE